MKLLEMIGSPKGKLITKLCIVAGAIGAFILTDKLSRNNEEIEELGEWDYEGCFVDCTDPDEISKDENEELGA